MKDYGVVYTDEFYSWLNERESYIRIFVNETPFYFVYDSDKTITFTIENLPSFLFGFGWLDVFQLQFIHESILNENSFRVYYYFSNCVIKSYIESSNLLDLNVYRINADEDYDLFQTIKFKNINQLSLFIELLYNFHLKCLE